MLQHLDVSPHQHSSITRSTHNFHQQLPCPKEEGACAVSTASHSHRVFLHSHLSQGFSTTTGRGFAPSVALGCSCYKNKALCFLPAPHSSASPHFSLYTPCHSCNTSHGPTAAPRAVPHIDTLCFGRQKPLTPEHQCPPAAGPVSQSQPQGLGNGPRSPALWKQKRKVRVSATV